MYTDAGKLMFCHQNVDSLQLSASHAVLVLCHALIFFFFFQEKD